MQYFGKDLLYIIESLKIQKNPKIIQLDIQTKVKYAFVLVDKTTNLYKKAPNDYKRLLDENFIKTFQKSTKQLENNLIMKTKHFVKNIKVEDWIESLVQKTAFITPKENKANFGTSHPCRLIKPSKSEMGNVSKVKLEKVSEKLVTSLNLNQWKNTDSVINWFSTNENKSQYFVIQLDISESYSSISKNIHEIVSHRHI